MEEAENSLSHSSPSCFTLTLGDCRLELSQAWAGDSHSYQG